MMKESLLVWVIVVILFILVLRGENKEHFSNPHALEGDDLWDEFYAGVYEILFRNKHRQDWEWAQISPYLHQWPTPQIRVGDLGCGVGFYAPYAIAEKVFYEGVDRSSAMIQKARKTVPDGSFRVGDFMNPALWDPESMTHMLCLYFSLYYADPTTVLRNMYGWLKPGGYVFLHVVDPDKFDPILEAASPFPLFSLQKYANERITTSQVNFDTFVYKSKFHKNAQNDEATFTEVFEFPDETTRTHRHRLTMPTIDEVLHIAQGMGFSLEAELDMVAIEWEYNSLLVLKK